MGTARIELAALIELKRLVASGNTPAHFRGGDRLAQEEDDETSQNTGAEVLTLGRQMNLMFETRSLDGLRDKERQKAVARLAKLLMQAAV